MNVVLTSIDLRAPIAVLVAIGVVAMGFRLYLGWAQRSDGRRASAVEGALRARPERVDPGSDSGG